MSKLITFITPSRRLDNIKGLIDNLTETTDNPEDIELLIKFDSDQQGVVEFIQDEIKNAPFSIRYIRTPRLEGIYSVWIGMEQLFYLSDPDSYFYQIISDEPRFLTKGWDTILRKYVGLYKDNIFRLRLSEMKVGNYTTHYECTFRPDSFPIYTRKWLELTEGTGDCWGSDAYQQCVAFQLSMGPGGYGNVYREDAYCRDIPIFDIKLGGLEFCVGVSPLEQRERHRRNLREWSRLTSFEMQEHFSYLARRINAYIYADQNEIKKFRILKNKYRKTVLLCTEDGEVVKEFVYSLSRLRVHSQNIIRYYIIKPRQIVKFFISDMYFLSINTAVNSYRKLVHTKNFIKWTTMKYLGILKRIINRILLVVNTVLSNIIGILRILLELTVVILAPIFNKLLDNFPKTKQAIIEGSARFGLKYTRFKQAFKSMITTFFENIFVETPGRIFSFYKNLVLRIFSVHDDKGTRKVLTKKQALKKLYNNTRIVLRIPFNVVSNQLAKMTHINPPGISVLHQSKPKMPNRIPVPTTSDAMWLKNELLRQEKERQIIREKEFVID